VNRRLIKKVLQQKHEDFVLSIKDERVQKLVKKNSIITGGCITSMLLNEKVNDFDYYFTNLETAQAVAEYFVKVFNELNPNACKKENDGIRLSPPEVKVIDGRVKIWIQSAGIIGEGSEEQTYKYFEQHPEEEGMDYIENVIREADETDSSAMEGKSDIKFRPVYLSSNAITLSDKVQLVIRFYGTPEEIHKNYDFIHCCNYWTSCDKELVLKPAAVESILCKQLQYQGSLYPLCSIIRTRKFIKKGWNINAGEYLKMCFQLSQLDLSDVKVLEDQLVGVDSAYFRVLLDYCKKEEKNDPEFRVTVPYIVSLVDRIFGE